MAYYRGLPWCVRAVMLLPIPYIFSCLHQTVCSAVNPTGLKSSSSKVALLFGLKLSTSSILMGIDLFCLGMLL